MPRKDDEMRAQWIAETQMFQRVARITVATDAELGPYWDAMKAPQKKRALVNIRTHRTIQDVANRAAKTRTN